MPKVEKYSKYKESGTEWLGNVPEEWKIDRIGSLYTLRNEKVSDSDYQPLSVTMQGVVPQLESAAKSNAHDDRKLVKAGDFAINSRSDRRGSCGISEIDGSVSLINTVLTPRGSMHPGYYNWLFHTVQFADEYYKWGHGIVDDLWTTRWQEMKKIIVPYPTIKEQERISLYLDNIIGKIDGIIRESELTVEEYKKCKLSLIHKCVTKGIASHKKMVPSGIDWIGNMPEQWKLRKIKYSFKVVSGATPKSDVTEYWDGDIAWITPADYKTDDKFVTHGKRFISQEGYESCGTTIVPPGSIIFSKRAPVGTVAINNEPLCTNQGCLSCIPCDDVDSEFYYYAMSVFTEQFELFSSGTTFKEISATSFGNFVLPYPQLSEQHEIAEALSIECKKIDDLISEKMDLIMELKDYRKALIYECVTGKRKVV